MDTYAMWQCLPETGSCYGALDVHVPVTIAVFFCVECDLQVLEPLIVPNRFSETLSSSVGMGQECKSTQAFSVEVVARRGKHNFFYAVTMSYAIVFVDVKQLNIPRVLIIAFDNSKRLWY